MTPLAAALSSPEPYFEITADSEARYILHELALLDQFGEFDRFPKPARFTERIVRYDEHPTHFIVAVHGSGGSGKEKTGYSARFFRKDCYTPKDVSEALATYFALAQHSVEYVNRKEYQKDKN
jgi:hypothetical protein